MATTTTTPAPASSSANMVGAGVGLVAGAAVGLGVAHVAKWTTKKKHHWTIITVVALGALGAYIGSQQ